MPLQKLSGGQRRRASLANELISNPTLLFLDEVTSGLDEQTDRELMRLFQRLRESGKTVVCVTHTLTNIGETSDLVALLTIGGKLAFLGTPREALQYFGIKRLGDVYEKLEKPLLAERWQRQFRESTYYSKYVTSRLSPGEVPKAGDNKLSENRYWQDVWPTLKHQLPVLLSRYCRVFHADRRALCGVALQVLVVAIMSYVVFGRVDQLVDEPFRQASLSCHLLFVMAVSCFWFGSNNSAKEIVKERDIYTKELQVNLDPTSYYLSKFALQLFVATLQSLVLFAAVSFFCGIPGAFAPQAAVLVLAAAAGVAMGLFVSAVATTEETALTLVPLALIPQIILSDIFVRLTGFSRWMGGIFITNYWCYGILRGLLPQDLVDQLHDPLAPPLPQPLGLTIIVMQIFGLAAGATLILHVRDRVRAFSKKSLRQILRDHALSQRLLNSVPARWLKVAGLG
jgi:hypothetical protein